MPLSLRGSLLRLQRYDSKGCLVVLVRRDFKGEVIPRDRPHRRQRGALDEFELVAVIINRDHDLQGFGPATSSTE